MLRNPTAIVPIVIGLRESRETVLPFPKCLTAVNVSALQDLMITKMTKATRMVRRKMIVMTYLPRQTEWQRPPTRSVFPLSRLCAALVRSGARAADRKAPTGMGRIPNIDLGRL
ncbi:Smc5-6 complex SMC subunit Smc5 [Histoplasma capsulatum var. duboisii H88]|uniref:Smc5-6 complex SMC subunit Smc5 n=1 Tax=Ajellomyces capsulatus (strain H88) TaxID=544711 RepID=A0A8A1LBB7_AJEC8|nr:Smc5-6 complex SMC subunit Smc5 [Histoplasma capsulatum var. duboisii H88]